jgi:crotonobetainyl-CoA:carnitine CoA-transferase CaiB-like acyl-CoA transferase
MTMSSTPVTAPGASARALQLHGVRVVEFTHMATGPSCGTILGDLGADVVKVEPIGGDNTRRLIGSGAGFFPMFNHNKMSIAVNTKGLARLRDCVETDRARRHTQRELQIRQRNLVLTPNR